jgi:hypothetical protein
MDPNKFSSPACILEPRIHPSEDLILKGELEPTKWGVCTINNDNST